MSISPTVLRYIVVALVIFLGSYAIYNSIYHYGYSVAEQKYTKVIDGYTNKQVVATKELESKVSSLISTTVLYNTNLSKDIGSIRNGLTGKTLVVLKDGKCSLSTDFLVSREAAIKRANQR